MIASPNEGGPSRAAGYYRVRLSDGRETVLFLEVSKYSMRPEVEMRRWLVWEGGAHFDGDEVVAGWYDDGTAAHACEPDGK